MLVFELTVFCQRISNTQPATRWKSVLLFGRGVSAGIGRWHDGLFIESTAFRRHRKKESKTACVPIVKMKCRGHVCFFTPMLD